MTEFVEAQGVVHLINPSMDGEFTLCGDAFDLASDVPGYQWLTTASRTVTCPACGRVIKACRGVRVDTP